uniref:Cadherin domain-containing protein n=1 Tax=Macrostomum lignano TaxID=282301 RepID=A0A1I8FK27_9PLAT
PNLASAFVLEEFSRSNWERKAYSLRTAAPTRPRAQAASFSVDVTCRDNRTWRGEHLCSSVGDRQKMRTIVDAESSPARCTQGLVPRENAPRLDAGCHGRQTKQRRPANSKAVDLDAFPQQQELFIVSMATDRTLCESILAVDCSSEATWTLRAGVHEQLWAQLTVRVTDVNDNPPEIEGFERAAKFAVWEETQQRPVNRDVRRQRRSTFESGAELESCALRCPIDRENAHGRFQVPAWPQKTRHHLQLRAASHGGGNPAVSLHTTIVQVETLYRAGFSRQASDSCGAALRPHVQLSRVAIRTSRARPDCPRVHGQHRPKSPRRTAFACRAAALGAARRGGISPGRPDSREMFCIRRLPASGPDATAVQLPAASLLTPNDDRLSRVYRRPACCRSRADPDGGRKFPSDLRRRRTRSSRGGKRSPELCVKSGSAWQPAEGRHRLPAPHRRSAGLRATPKLPLKQPQASRRWEKKKMHINTSVFPKLQQAAAVRRFPRRPQEYNVPIVNAPRLAPIGRRIGSKTAPVAYNRQPECRTQLPAQPRSVEVNSLYLALEFCLKQAPSSADLSTPNWSSMAKVRGSTRLSRPLLKSNAATRPSTWWSDASVRCRGDASVRCREVTPPSGAEVTPPSGVEVTPPSGVEVPSDALRLAHTNLCLLWHLSLRSRPADSVTQFTVQSALSGEAGVQLDEAEPHRVEQLCRLAAVDSEAELVHKVQLRLGEHRRQLRRVSLAVEVGLVEVGLKLRHHVALLVVQPPAAGTSALRPPPPSRRDCWTCRVGQTVEVGAEQTDPGVSAVRQSAYQSVLLLTLDGRELSPALRVGIYPLELLLECVEGVESRQIESDVAVRVTFHCGAAIVTAAEFAEAARVRPQGATDKALKRRGGRGAPLRLQLPLLTGGAARTARRAGNSGFFRSRFSELFCFLVWIAGVSYRIVWD